MFDAAPQPTPAVCNIRAGIEEVKAPCAFTVKADGNIAVVIFTTQAGIIGIGGTLNNDGMEASRIMTDPNAKPKSIVGHCGHNAQTKRIACVWYDATNTQYAIVAQY